MLLSQIPAVKGKNINNQKKKKSSKLTKEIKLPLGKSYIDYLLDGVIHSIYYYKHQLEFAPTLNILSKLRLAIESEIVDTRIPIKKLLEIATNRKQYIYIYIY